MVNFRTQKVNEDMKRIISEIIRDDVNDPKVPKMCSIMRVEATKDLKHAKVFVSTFGGEEEINGAVKALNKAAGFIKHRLSEIMVTRSVPSLRFVGDFSLEHSINISKKINELHNEK